MYIGLPIAYCLLACMERDEHGNVDGHCKAVLENKVTHSSDSDYKCDTQGEICSKHHTHLPTSPIGNRQWGNRP